MYNTPKRIQYAKEMPLELLTNPRLEDGAKTLYGLIVIFQGRYGTCSAKNETFAELMRRMNKKGEIVTPSLSSIKKWLKQLEDELYIARNTTKINHGDGFTAVRSIELKMYKGGCRKKYPNNFDEICRERKNQTYPRWYI